VGYFVFGLGLFALAVAVFAVSGNPILIPTVALIGNFLVPVRYVASSTNAAT
jgi:hypothetical protein